MTKTMTDGCILQRVKGHVPYILSNQWERVTMILLLLLCIYLTAVASVSTGSGSTQYVIQSMTLDNTSRLDIPSSILKLIFRNMTFLISTCEVIDQEVEVQLERSTIQTFCLNPSVKQIDILYCNISEFTIASQIQSASFNTTNINIGNSPITSIPSNISTLTKLKFLNIYRAPLQKVNLSDLNELNNLFFLSLNECNISEVIVDVPVELPSLDSISLRNNSIKRIDMHRWNMPRLKSLVLSYNLLSEFPPLNRFPNLAEVSLSNNFFNTVNMSQVSGLADLWRLDLSNNQILHLDASEPIHLPALHSFNLGRNSLQNLNLSAWDVPSLYSINLQGNLLHRIDGIESIADSLMEISISGNMTCQWLTNATIKLKANCRDDCTGNRCQK